MPRSRMFGLMNDFEVLRLLSFADDVRRPFLDMTPTASEDPTWNIARHLVEAHLRGELVAISTLAQASCVPYTTALRRIEAMTEHGLIVRKPHGTSGKSFGLAPSDALLRQVYTYVRSVKSLLARTVGFRRAGEDVDDYYFGGLPPGEVPQAPPRLLNAASQQRERLRFLVDDDNYFEAMQRFWGDFRNNVGSQRDFRRAPLPELYGRIVANAQEASSSYDVVAVNLPWIGGLVEAGMLHDISAELAHAGIRREDFHPDVWRTGQWRGKQYLIPMYCTIESFAFRRDLLEQSGRSPPTTFDRVIETGRALHDPKRGRVGIVWNAARGMPIASSFMFLLGCCGRPILREGVDPSGAIGGEDVDLGAAAAVLDYMHRLAEIGPPDLADLDWEQSLQVFLEGRAAMTYCWTMRATRFEYDIRSRVQRKVAYLPQPAGPGGRARAPLGGFALGVPSNLPAERVQAAVDAIAWMASPETMQTHVRDGVPILPHFSFASDPEMMQGSGVARFVEGLARRHMLDTHLRPPIGCYRELENVLGEEVHDALTLRRSDAQAIEAMSARIGRLFDRKRRPGRAITRASGSSKRSG